MSTTETTPPSKSKLEVIRDISTALVERRKARGLSLDKINQLIKIRLPYLEAMEKGQWDQLPGEVYVRGFIKRYAVFLGMDAAKLLEPYIAISDELGEKAEKAQVPVRVADRTPVLWIWVGLATFLLIAIINLARNERSKLEAAPPATAAEVAAVPETPVVVETPAPSPESHKLEIIAPSSLWLRVESQDRTFEGFIPSNATWTWKGQGVFSVRLGHTNQVMMLFDGQPVKLAENQKRIRLPREN